MQAGSVLATQYLTATQCCVCGVAFALPDHMLKKKQASGGDFHCPNGHTLSYTETDLKRTQRELAQVRSRLDQVEAEKAKAEKELKKAKKQVACGQCPVCDRSFRSLRTHMANKHPEFVTDAAK